MSSILNSLSAAQLKRAVAIKEQIENLEMELSRLGESSLKAARGAAPIIAPKKGDKTAAKPKRHISAAGRARIIAATKARWARYNAAKKAQ